jgi:hypothetical protein
LTVSLVAREAAPLRVKPSRADAVKMGEDEAEFI